MVIGKIKDKSGFKAMKLTAKAQTTDLKLTHYGQRIPREREKGKKFGHRN